MLPHLSSPGPKGLTSEQHLVLEEALDYTQHTMLHALAAPLRTLLLGEGRRRDAVRDPTTHRAPPSSCFPTSCNLPHCQTQAGFYQEALTDHLSGFVVMLRNPLL